MLFQDENAKPVKGRVTLKMLSQWQAELQTEGKIKLATLTTVIKAFNAAMLRATSDDGTSKGEFKVEGMIFISLLRGFATKNSPATIFSMK